MRYLFFALIFISVSCNQIQVNQHKPLFLNKGDCWINCYDQLNINTVTIVYRNDKLYCSTNHINDINRNAFYCFDLKSGKVSWENDVNASSTYNPIVLNDVIYYVTYTGDRYAYDTLGHQIWYKVNRPPNVYSPTMSTYNSINHNLLINDVIGHFNEFDKRTGELFHAPLNNSDDNTTVLPVYIGNYIYSVMKGDSVGVMHTMDKFWPLLVGRNYLTGKVVWQKQNFNCSELYARQGVLFARGVHKIYSINSTDGAVIWCADSLRVPSLNTNYALQFLSNRILLSPNGTGKDSTYTALDYETGNILPYKRKSEVYTYMLGANKHLYSIRVTIGSDKSNNPFDEATEVKVEKVK